MDKACEKDCCQIDAFVAALRDKLGKRKPKYLLILGSGLGDLAEKLEDSLVVPFTDLGLPPINISGHAGKIAVGKLGAQEVVCMQGRFHLFEGHQARLIKQIICAFAAIGVKELIVTNAAGSLRQDMPPGSLMLISDHINFSGQNPLVGFNDENYGPRFPDMSDVYDREKRKVISQIAERCQIKLYSGVYFMVLGPNFETAAEIRAFRLLGADAVGMSTVPEVIAAVYAGLKVIGLSVITNYGTGIGREALEAAPDCQSHGETLAQAREASAQLAQLLSCYMEEY